MSTNENPTEKPRPRPKRASRRSLKAWAGIGAVAAFAVPWAAIHAVPRPAPATTAQIVTLPIGQRVVIPASAPGQAGVTYVTVNGKAATSSAPAAPATSTRASGVPR